MNEELKRQLLDLADKAKQVGADASAFAQQQAPELVKEILRWEMASSICRIALGVVVFIACCAWIKKSLKADPGLNGRSIPACMIGGAGAAVFFGVAASGIYDLVKVLVAPRLVLLEILSGLLHK